MKNKKGFTLIEILVAIVLMLSLTALAIVAYSKINKSNKVDQYNMVVEEIKTAAENYINRNEYLINDINENVAGYIPVKYLVDADYLGVLIDPRSKEKINECNYVEVKKNNGNIQLEYVENNLSEGECYFSNAIQFVTVGSTYNYNIKLYNNLYTPIGKDSYGNYYNTKRKYINIKTLADLNPAYDNTNSNDNILHVCLETDDTGISNVKYNGFSTSYDASHGYCYTMTNDFKPESKGFTYVDSFGNNGMIEVVFGKDTVYPTIEAPTINKYAGKTTYDIGYYDNLDVYNILHNFDICSGNMVLHGIKNCYVTNSSRVAPIIKSTYFDVEDGAGNRKKENYNVEVLNLPTTTTTTTTTITTRDTTPPTVNVKVYKVNGYSSASGYSLGNLIVNKDVSGTNNVINVESLSWLGKSYSNYGIYIKFKSNESGTAGIYVNTYGKNDTEISSSTYRWTGSNFNNGTDYNETIDTTNGNYYNFANDGARRSKVIVKDNSGNTTDFEVNANLDYSAPTITLSPSASTAANNWSRGTGDFSCGTGGTKTCKFYVNYSIEDKMSGIDKNNSKRYWNKAKLDTIDSATTYKWDDSSYSYPSGDSGTISGTESTRGSVLEKLVGKHSTTSGGDGARRLTISVCDKANNCSKQEIITYLDWTKPTIKVNNIHIQQWSRKNDNNGCDDRSNWNKVVKQATLSYNQWITFVDVKGCVYVDKVDASSDDKESRVTQFSHTNVSYPSGDCLKSDAPCYGKVVFTAVDKAGNTTEYEFKTNGKY